jgi:hypothetical protein
MPTVAESYRKQLTENNAAEQMNSVIQDIRHQPILDLLVGLSRWRIGKSFERREMSKKWIELGCTSNAWNLPCNVLVSLLWQCNMLRTKQKCIHVAFNKSTSFTTTFFFEFRCPKLKNFLSLCICIHLQFSEQTRCHCQQRCHLYRP